MGLRALLVGCILLAGCVAVGMDEEGIRLEERRACEGHFLDGTPVHCEQRAKAAILHDEVPAFDGWIATTSLHPAPGTFWRKVDPLDGPLRLGLSYVVERGAIDQEITLDPIGGVAWHPAWSAPYSWESGQEAFIEFPEPIEELQPFEIVLYHPHIVANDTPLFTVAKPTPALHNKPLETLWDHNDGLRVVHRVHGDGGPYHFHEGQPHTGVVGHSLSQEGEDYSIVSRLVLFLDAGFHQVP